MSSNEPSNSRIAAEDSEDRPKKRGIEDSEAVENKKVRGPDESSFSQVSLYNPAFNPFISMFNPWLNPFFQPFLLFQMMAALQAGIQGFGALGTQEVEEKPEEADVSEFQKVVLENQEVEVEEPSKDQKVEPEVKVEAQCLTPNQIEKLQWAYDINSSPTAKQMVLLADKLQLSQETVKKYFEDRRKEQDLPLTQGSIILTRNLANHVNHLISKHRTTQEIFGKRVIGRSNGRVSDLIKYPRPYESLRPEGRRVWERMLAWVKLCEKDRKAVLEEKPTECCPFEALKDSPLPAPRTTFTPNQKQRLRDAFAANRCPDQEQRAQLAAELQLKPDTVKYYFRYRRRRSNQLL